MATKKAAPAPPPAKKAPAKKAAPAPTAKKAPAKAPAPKAAPAQTAGEDLAAAQERLGDKAIKQWQKANGYRPDGILTPRQYQKMSDSA